MRATDLHPSRKERNEDLNRATALEEIPVYLRRYADGEAPIPSKEDLRREAHEKRAGNGHEETAGIKTGPDLIGSAPPQAFPISEIPVRPD